MNFVLCASTLICASPVLAQSEFDGPYPVVMDVDPNLPTYTIYRPADLSIVPGKLPLVAFGNGGCFNQGNLQENLLGQLASYGMVVTVPGPTMVGGVKQDMPPGGIPAHTRSRTRPSGHVGTWSESHGGAMGMAALAWVRWQLQGDTASARMFQGVNCGLCTDKRWTIKKKNMG